MISDKEYEKQKKRVIGMCRRWAPILGLSDWTITFVWNREQSWQCGSNNSHVSPLFSVEFARWKYMDVEIVVDVPQATRTDDARVEREIVHELCHVLVCELIPEDQDNNNLEHEERVVTLLTKAIMRVKGMKP